MGKDMLVQLVTMWVTSRKLNYWGPISLTLNLDLASKQSFVIPKILAGGAILALHAVSEYVHPS